MAFASGHENGIVAYPDDPPVLPPEPVLRLKALEPHAVFFRGLDKRKILLGDKANPILRTCQPFLLGVTKDRLDLRAHVVPFSVQADFCDITDRRHLSD